MSKRSNFTEPYCSFTPCCSGVVKGTETGLGRVIPEDERRPFFLETFLVFAESQSTVRVK